MNPSPGFDSSPLRAALVSPAVVRQFGLAEWDSLVQQGRATGLLARVAALLWEEELETCIPDEVRWHLQSAHQVYIAHCDDIRLEIAHVVNALSPLGLRPVLLKGGAYFAAGDRAMIGRLYSDLDIFVPRERLSEVEEVLGWLGWASEPLSRYDEMYYRRWMHELPPMVHRSTGIALDVHHNLLPLTSRVSLDAAKFVGSAVPSRIQGVDTLSPADRVLHSAAHLLLGGEFDNAFRDLSDLRLLLEQMASDDPAFWDSLVMRAEELGLGRVLFYMLRYLRGLLNQEVPPEVLKSTQPYAPGKATCVLMDRLFERALLPGSMVGDGVYRQVAELALLTRSHYLKMPVPLLARHLAHKMFVTPFERLHQDRVG